MKKKLSKVLAVVLSLVLAVGLAAVDGVSVAQAAKAKKIKLTTNSDSSELTSGQTVVIKAKGKNAKKAKWSIKGDTTFAELNKTKGKKVKLTVKENATGTVKVVAKVTKKNKASVSFTLSCEADAITVTDAEGFTNEAIALTTTPTPSNAKLGDVTYAVYTDETAATEAKAEEATVADGALTAKVAGTYYVIAKTTTAAGEISSPAAKVVVTEKTAGITEIKQTYKEIIEVTFDSDASNATTDDIVIENSIGVRVNIKTIEFTNDEKTTAKITTLRPMADGKEYTVTYGESSKKFVATTGEVSSIGITPGEVPVDVEVDIYAVALDVNGVILDEVSYATSLTNNNYTFEIDSLGAAYEITGDNKLKMTEIGSEVMVKVTYVSKDQLGLDGNLKTFPAEKKIVAIAPGSISGYDAIAFFMGSELGNRTEAQITDYFESNTYETITKYSSFKVRDKVRVMADGTPFYVAAYVKDDLGYVRVNGSLTAKGYTLESADDTYLLVQGDKLKGVRAGKTHILVKDGNDVLFYIPVEIEAASVLTTIITDKNSVTLSAGNYAEASDKATEFVGAEASITISTKDQYGEDYGAVKITATSAEKNYDYMFTAENEAELMTGTHTFGVTVADPDADLDATSKWTQALQKDNYLKEGEAKANSYTITVEDTVNEKISFKKNVTVSVRRPVGDMKTIGLSVNNGGSMHTEDTKVISWESDERDPKEVKVRLACYDKNGIFMEHAYLPTMGALGTTATIDLKKGNTLAKEDTFTRNDVANTKKECVSVIGGDEENGANYYSFISRVTSQGALTADDGKYVIDKAENATYRIAVKGVKLTVTPEGTPIIQYGQEKKYTSLAATIMVVDSQEGIKTNQETKATDINIEGADSATVSAIAKDTIRVIANDASDTVHEADNGIHEADDDDYLFYAPNAKVTKDSVAFTKLIVFVPYSSGDTLVLLPVEVNVNYTVVNE